MIKSARGKKVNMATIVAKGERQRAVSNAPLNARGDIIDSRGEIKVTREHLSKEFYKNNLPGIEEEISISSSDSDTTDVIEEVAIDQEEMITEVSRTERVRDDGTPFIEVEYSDGSMSNILSAQSNKKKSKTKT
tara:strand:+ start:50 stop:451 length:402 start_codon:yes stop_codon:yes gene_type:complete